MEGAFHLVVLIVSVLLLRKSATTSGL